MGTVLRTYFSAKNQVLPPKFPQKLAGARSPGRHTDPSSQCMEEEIGEL
jgi:hypothetical protein